MLDGLSLDQIRTFLAAVDEGSFSAAGRRLGRAQSVVSQTLANLEAQLQLKLFDRSGHRPKLTAAGCTLVEQARLIIGSTDRFRATARGMAGGIEAELPVVVDVMYPIERLAKAIVAVRTKFPETVLRLHVEALGAVLKPILDGDCTVGIMGSLPVAPPELSTEPLSHTEMVTVAAPGHTLAAFHGAVPEGALAHEVQLVLTDRSTLSQGREFGIMSTRLWHLADLGAKHEFLRQGLGYGSMPLPMVNDDLEAGRLVRLQIDGAPARFMMRMMAVYRTAAPPGPAGRCLIDLLKDDPSPGQMPIIAK